MNAFQQRLLAAFQVEHRDHIEAARSLLHAFEQAGWTSTPDELVELHRRIHSLKGAARAVDLKSIETLSHRLETAIERCQEGHCALAAAVGRIMRDTLDAIEDGVAAILQGQEPEPTDAVVAALDTLATGTDAPGEAIPDARTTAPVADDPDSSAAPAERPIERTGVDRLSGEESFRIDARSLDGLLQCAGEVLTSAAHHGRLREEFHRLQSMAAQCTRIADNCRKQYRGPGHSNEWTALTDRRDADFLALETLVRDLGNSLKSLETSYLSDAWQLRQLGRRFDTEIRRARMVPADSVFGGARKMVRDLLRDQGKEARVDVYGLNSLADRWVLQSLKDPVMHALRNAVSHGIEMPDERVAAGKGREGNVVLSIALQGSRLAIRIEDDGRGVDAERVRRVAQAKGILPTEITGELDDHALTAILSRPGFSTAEKVTELAGRGIGLSVVTQAVARLHGEYRIGKRDGGGTVVAILVPMIVSSEQLVLVTSGAGRYSLPAHGVKGFLRISRDKIGSLEGRPVLIDGGRPPLPLVPLSVLLGGKDDSTADQGQVSILELQSQDVHIGALVDSIVSVREGMVRDIGIAGKDSNLVTGGLVAETGVVVPVLSVPALIEAYFRKFQGWRLDEKPDAKRDRQRTILVVDDSITTRTLEKSILEANGYRVRVSVDGSGALEVLRSHPVDLVVSDIEMPEMNGFELLRAIRQDNALTRIPVILVTSRSKDEDKRKGLALGADAYVVKQRFDQNSLLETITQLI